MIAVIDADIICYEFGNMRDLESTEILPWPIVRKFVDERIAMILEESESTYSSCTLQIASLISVLKLPLLYLTKARDLLISPLIGRISEST